VSLSDRDKLALMMTSAGSMRELGLLIGASHQKIGRWLRGESNIPTDKLVRGSIDYAFKLHKEEARRIAREDGLPFDASIPVLAERQRFKTGPKKGEKGERVAVNHTHWLSDDLRRKMIASQQKSGKYYAASIGSIVNLQIYNDGAEERIKKAIRKEHRRRAKSEHIGKLQIQLKMLQGAKNAAMYTPLQPMDKRIPSYIINDNFDEALQQRHEPATGEKGTELANTVLLQLTPSTIKPQNAKSDNRPTGPKARARNSTRNRRAR
jgi:hypothetical protein